LAGFAALPEAPTETWGLMVEEAYAEYLFGLYLAEEFNMPNGLAPGIYNEALPKAYPRSIERYAYWIPGDKDRRDPICQAGSLPAVMPENLFARDPSLLPALHWSGKSVEAFHEFSHRLNDIQPGLFDRLMTYPFEENMADQLRFLRLYHEVCDGLLPKTILSKQLIEIAAVFWISLPMLLLKRDKLRGISVYAIVACMKIIGHRGARGLAPEKYVELVTKSD